MKSERNSDLEKFEARLAELSPGALPPGWRNEVLATSNADDAPLLAWLFPKPLAISLAALWVLIAAIHFSSSSPDRIYQIAKKADVGPAPAHAGADFRSRLYASLLNYNEEQRDDF